MTRAVRHILRSVAAALLLAATAMSGEAQAPAAPSADTWTDPSPHRVRLIRVAPDAQLEVLDWGVSGPTLVFLTGSGNTAHVFDDFAPRFRDRFHVYAITRRGFGASSPARGYNAATRARDIVTILDSLHARRAVLAGHSIAGDELSKVGATYPARVRALVYLDAPDYGRALAAVVDAKRALIALMPTMTSADSASPAAVTAFMRRAFLDAGPESEVRQTYTFGPDGHLIGEVDAGGLEEQELIAGVGKQDFARINAPALGLFAVYSGPAALLSYYPSLDSTRRAQTDRGYGGLMGWATTARDRFRAQMRHGTIVELSDARHHIFLTQPDRVEREMRNFLARVR